VREYEHDQGRKPMLVELIQMVETVLATNIDAYTHDGRDKEIVALNVKTKKYQSFHVGDFFAIPIKKGTFAFGRILSDLQVAKIGLLVGIYKQTEKKILTPLQLKGSSFMFPPFYCSEQGWKTWRWKIIGNIPVESNEFIYPKHKEGLDGLGWWIIDKDKSYPATEKEVQSLEYARLWSVESVEKRIKENIQI
jgi:hypothetical protein